MSRSEINEVNESSCGLFQLLITRPICGVFRFIGKIISGTHSFICNASWVFFTIGIIMIGPYAFEMERIDIENAITEKL